MGGGWRARRNKSNKQISTDAWPSFGDGAHWRKGEDVFTGPVLDEAAEKSPIYSHGEEASVEIVRPRLRSGPSSDPSEDHHHKMESAAKKSDALPSFKGQRRPVKRFFNALKRG